MRGQPLVRAIGEVRAATDCQYLPGLRHLLVQTGAALPARLLYVDERLGRAMLLILPAAGPNVLARSTHPWRSVTGAPLRG